VPQFATRLEGAGRLVLGADQGAGRLPPGTEVGDGSVMLQVCAWLTPAMRQKARRATRIFNLVHGWLRR